MLVNYAFYVSYTANSKADPDRGFVNLARTFFDQTSFYESKNR